MKLMTSVMIIAWLEKYIFFNKIPYPWREDADCDYLWDYLKESEEEHDKRRSKFCFSKH